jgi:hypothetical protein
MKIGQEVMLSDKTIDSVQEIYGIKLDKIQKISAIHNGKYYLKNVPSCLLFSERHLIPTLPIKIDLLIKEINDN